MKSITFGLGILLLLVAWVPSSNAQTSNSAMVSVCAPPLPVVAGASIGAGYINLCVQYPPTVNPGSTFEIIGMLTAPTTVLPVFTTASNAFFPNNGCTEGTPVQLTPSSNGVAGTSVTHATFITMTSEECDIIFGATLSIGTPTVQIYNSALPIHILTENLRVDNFNYLCDAPAIAPNAYSTTSTVCNDPNLVFTGTLTLSGIPDTQQEIQAIADALVAGVDVNICPVDAPCYHVLSGSLDTNSTITVNGNVTINSGNNTSGNTTTGGSGEAHGFNGSLYVLIMVIALALAHIAEIRGDNGLRAIAGFIVLVAGFVAMWEMDLLGFNHLENTAIEFLIGWMGIHLALGIYLMIPKEDKEEVKTNG